MPSRALAQRFASRAGSMKYKEERKGATEAAANEAEVVRESEGKLAVVLLGFLRSLFMLIA